MKIGIDMDGVVANAIKKLVSNANKRFFLNIQEEEVDEHGVHNLVIKKLPDGYVKMRFTTAEEVKPLIYSKNFFLSLEEHVGAMNAVREIHGMGHKIVFVTKVMDWETSPGDKHKWLENRLSDIDWDFICVGDMKVKSLIDVDVLIDDDPRAISAFPRQRMIVKRPWNKKYREQKHERELIEVRSITEAVEKIKEMTR